MTIPNAEGRTSTFQPRVAWFLSHYPITLLVIAPYAAFVIPSAVAFRNPHTGILVWLVAVAAVSAGAAETAVRAMNVLGGRLPRAWPARLVVQFPRVAVIARLTAITSMFADLSAALSGKGTIVTQVTGSVGSSQVANTAGMFEGWKYIAVAVLLGSVTSGYMSIAEFYRWLAALVATQLYLVSLTAITAPSVTFVTFVAATGAVSGVIRVRYIVTAAAALLLAWPTVFALRNEHRVEYGVSVADGATAGDRLRFDLQMSRMTDYAVPVDVGQPGASEAVRYGFVPRALDPNRPPLSTGMRINRYMGGSGISAYSFTGIGNVYFLNGLAGVIVYYSFWSAVAAFLLRFGRRLGLFRLIMLCLVIVGPLMWLSMYPDSMIGMAQHLVSGIPIFLTLWLSRVAPGGRLAGRRSDRLELGQPARLR